MNGLSFVVVGNMFLVLVSSDVFRILEEEVKVIFVSGGVSGLGVRGIIIKVVEGILSVLLFVKVRGMFFIVVDDDLFSDFESSFYDY